MATLYLLCGLPGAGKTSLAKRLEQERSALRFTPDDWITALGIDLFDEDKRAVVEAIQWSLAERALSLGASVVIDFGSGRARSAIGSGCVPRRSGRRSSCTFSTCPATSSGRA